MNETRLRRQRGFTLIELLVVISIIALLIGLLLPGLRSARTSAWQVTELSNMRQCAVAALTYTADYDDYFNPIQDQHPVKQGNGTKAVEGTWRAYLWEYVSGAPSSFDSPAEKFDIYGDGLSEYDVSKSRGRMSGPDPEAYGVISEKEQYNRSGIGANLVHYWAGREGKGPFGRPRISSWGKHTGDNSGYSEGLAQISEVQETTQCILFGSGGTDDARWPEDNWWIYKIDGPVRSKGFSRYLQFVQYDSDYGARRFNERGNYTFADGSGKTLDPRDIPCDERACWWSVDLDPHD